LTDNHQTRATSPLLDEYFDGVPALAKELKRAERTIWRWRALRTGPPATLIGGRLYFRKSAVKQWLLDSEES
jgi:predicted DNA-binding transcriptional regulator AlpA